MKRLVAALVGVSFTALGAAMAASFLFVLVADRATVALVGLLPAVLGLLLGPVVLTRAAYDVTADSEGLNLRFVFRSERVPWTRVRSYRKIGVTWGAAVDGAVLRAGIFIILDYDRAASADAPANRAYFWVVGLGPAFSRSSEDYRTFLDEHVPEKNRRRSAPAASVILGILMLLFTNAALAAPADDVLDSALRALVAGNHERLASLFRYFEESVPSGEAAKDRQVIWTFFGLVQRNFGRPEPFEPTRRTSSIFVNVYMESATPDLWRNSECVFRTYAYRTTFRKGSVQRPAELLVEVCLNPQLRPVWLRKVDIHFPEPDDATVQTARQLFDELRREIRRVRGAG